MIYFSELRGKVIRTEDQIKIGFLEDVIFLAEDNPKITKFIIRSNLKEKLIIPVAFLKKINNDVIISKDYNTADLQENELYLVKNLLDKQIIDLIGNKIVRVNDVALQEKGIPYIAGVDIGILGILRWLKLEESFQKLFAAIRINISPKFLSWADIQPLELVKGKVVLKKEEGKLEKIRPEDLADHLEKTNIINVRKILNMLDENFAAEVIGNLNLNYQNELFRQFSPQKAARVVSLIDPDEAVDVLLTLSRKRRERIYNFLDDQKKKELDYLLKLAKTPIGGLITSEYVTASPEDTVKKVIEIIRSRAGELYFLNYVFVINQNHQLVGVFNLHELLLQKDETPVYKFMIQNVVVIHLTTPREIALNKMLKYKIQAIPVIDLDKNLLGIVTFDDMAEFILKKL